MALSSKDIDTIKEIMENTVERALSPIKEDILKHSITLYGVNKDNGLVTTVESHTKFQTRILYAVIIVSALTTAFNIIIAAMKMFNLSQFH